MPKVSTGSSTHKWDWGAFPGKKQVLLEENKFDSMALKTSGRGGDRHALLRDGPDAGLGTLGRAEGSSQREEHGSRGLGVLWQLPLHPGKASWQMREPPLPRNKQQPSQCFIKLTQLPAIAPATDTGLLFASWGN